MKAVQYDRFGGVEVLEVREVARPVAGEGQVVVRVRAAGINPGESSLREGVLKDVFPSTFPSGQGSDLAGVVDEVGADVDGWQVGDEVVGWTDERASHAEYVLVPVGHLIRKPAGVSWEVAGATHVVGATAWAAVRAVDPQPGETVLVSGAAGGVGGLAAQLVAERGARVLGVAGPANHDWLRAHGVEPVSYDGGPDALEARLRDLAPDGVHAVVDTVGQGYVELAVRLGVQTDRVNTNIDFAAAQQYGVKADGSTQGANVPDLTAVLDRLADGRLELPIAARYPLAEVADAFTELDRRHTRGKIVLVP
ncbi:NADP-dependent oxidoreductase [Jatrophihabitans fulvus]